MSPLAAPVADPALRLRLARLARVVRALVLLGAAVLVGLVLWSWSVPEQGLWQSGSFGLRRSFHLGTSSWLLGALCTLVPAVVMLLALRSLWRLFGEYGQGRVFHPAAPGHLRDFARWLLAESVVGPAYDALLSVAATWNDGAGHRQLELAFGSDDYLMLMFGLVVLAIATVMTEAARVAADHAAIV